MWPCWNHSISTSSLQRSTTTRMTTSATILETQRRYFLQFIFFYSTNKCSQQNAYGHHNVMGTRTTASFIICPTTVHWNLWLANIFIDPPQGYPLPWVCNFILHAYFCSYGYYRNDTMCTKYEPWWRWTAMSPHRIGGNSSSSRGSRRVCASNLGK
jgi:hypothetical protein